LFHIAEPIVAKHGAAWVKVDADDLFITVPDPSELFGLAHDLQASIRDHNAKDKEHPIGLAIGLGFGPILVVEHDIFGDAVNTASKLGEDIGKEGEILLTEAMYQALKKEEAALCTPAADYAARGSKYPFYTCH